MVGIFHGYVTNNQMVAPQSHSRIAPAATATELLGDQFYYAPIPRLEVRCCRDGMTPGRAVVNLRSRHLNMWRYVEGSYIKKCSYPMLILIILLSTFQNLSFEMSMAMADQKPFWGCLIRKIPTFLSEAGGFWAFMQPGWDTSQAQKSGSQLFRGNWHDEAAGNKIQELAVAYVQKNHVFFGMFFWDVHGLKRFFSQWLY